LPVIHFDVPTGEVGAPAGLPVFATVGIVLPRRLVAPFAVALVILGAALIAIAIVYFVVPAGHLPGWWPGHDAVRYATKEGRAVPGRYTSRGTFGLLVALGAISAAWWITFRYEPTD
jgi:hypothetical protein